jgi:hypothetical protein
MLMLLKLIVRDIRLSVRVLNISDSTIIINASYKKLFDVTFK